VALLLWHIMKHNNTNTLEGGLRKYIPGRGVGAGRGESCRRKGRGGGAVIRRKECLGEPLFNCKNNL
jgi:hypothetical protein